MRLPVLFLLLISKWSYALDEKRLWLPVKYQALYLPLVEAATAAEALERCVDVVEGTIDLEQSAAGQPIFRIVCRQENGRTYSEMVDGISFATMTTPKVVAPEPTAEELEQQRLQEEQRRQAEVDRAKRDAWQLCRMQMLERTRMMMDLVWLTDIETQREPDVHTENEIGFTLSFDARSMWREPLHYTAECVVRGVSAEVSLRKR